MFSHPVTVIGYVLIAAGVLGALSGDYLWLVLGMSAEALGFFLILIGVVAQGFLRIERYLAGIPEMKAAFESSEPAKADSAGGYVGSGAQAVDAMELQRQISAMKTKRGASH